MSRQIATVICTMACRVLPDSRRLWGEAMTGELPQAADAGEALRFAAGCLLAALYARLNDLETRFGIGIWGIATVSAAYAIVRLACGGRGVAVLLGAPDGMRAALVVHGAAPAVTASYDAARPVVVGCFLVLGLVQLATAWFLSQRQFRALLFAWSIGLVIAGLAVGIQLSIVWDVDGLPSEFHGLLLQALAVPALLAWYYRQIRLERTSQ